MGQIVALAEAVKPCCHTVGVHGLTVILREYKTIALIVCAQLENLFSLPRLILPEKLHRLSGQSDKALAALGLGAAFVYAFIRRV